MARGDRDMDCEYATRESVRPGLEFASRDVVDLKSIKSKLHDKMLCA